MLRRLPLFVAAFAVLAALFSSPASAAEAAVTVRGGDTLYSGASRCRVGFNAHQGTTNYGLMAGHCLSAGTTWYRDSAHTQPVGTAAGSSFPGNDYGVLRYFDTVSAPSVVASGSSTFPITTARNPVVGEQVCMPSLTGGLQCGRVTAVNVTVSYPEGSISGLFSANLCVEPGDMGGPGFSGTAALGIAVGGQGTCSSGGTTFFQPVVEILSAYGLTVG
ncbi:S1 family peptidase [Streptomyces sp. NPDC005925]|uniref:S1 family peptidase n=1 Tax=Streptomyces sp. NPDC005925 TaxID=3157172 RepID=UPI00340C3806